MKHVIFLSLLTFIALPAIGVAAAADDDDIVIATTTEQMEIISDETNDEQIVAVMDTVADDDAISESVDDINTENNIDVALQSDELESGDEIVAMESNVDESNTVAVNDTDVTEIAVAAMEQIPAAAPDRAKPTANSGVTAMDKLRANDAAKRNPRSGTEPKIAKQSAPAAPMGARAAVKLNTATIRKTPVVQTVSTTKNALSTNTKITSAPVMVKRTGLDETAVPMRSISSSAVDVIYDEETPL